MGLGSYNHLSYILSVPISFLFLLPVAIPVSLSVPTNSKLQLLEGLVLEKKLSANLTDKISKLSSSYAFLCPFWRGN